MPRACLACVCVLLLFSMLRPGRAQEAQASDPDRAVATGREALNSGWSSSYPWYDPATDGVKRIDLQTKAEDNTASSQTAGQTASPGAGLSSLFPAMAWTLLALLLGGLAYFLVMAYLNRDRGAAQPDVELGQAADRSEIDRVEALPFRINRNTTDLLAEARRNYQAGQYGEAIIYLFSHQLVVLDRHQFIHLTKGKTNRQYLRELRTRPPVRGLLEQTMVAFEDVFFGNHALERNRFEDCWMRLDEFDRLIEQGAPA